MVKSFANPLPHFSWQGLQVHVVLSGENEIARRNYFLSWDVLP